jgi:hypothetical protein
LNLGASTLPQGASRRSVGLGMLRSAISFRISSVIRSVFRLRIWRANHRAARMRGSRPLFAALALVLVNVAGADETKQLLVLYSNNRLLPANIAVDAGLREAFPSGREPSIHIFYWEDQDPSHLIGCCGESGQRPLGEQILTAKKVRMVQSPSVPGATVRFRIVCPSDLWCALFCQFASAAAARCSDKSEAMLCGGKNRNPHSVATPNLGMNFLPAAMRRRAPSMPSPGCTRPR